MERAAAVLKKEARWWLTVEQKGDGVAGFYQKGEGADGVVDEVRRCCLLLLVREKGGLEQPWAGLGRGGERMELGRSRER